MRLSDMQLTGFICINYILVKLISEKKKSSTLKCGVKLTTKGVIFKRKSSPSFWVKTVIRQYFEAYLCIETVWITKSDWPAIFLNSLKLVHLQKRLRTWIKVFYTVFQCTMLPMSELNKFFNYCQNFLSYCTQ